MNQPTKTITATITDITEITIPWRDGPEREEALRFRSKVEAAGLPYTYTYEVPDTMAILASIELEGL